MAKAIEETAKGVQQVYRTKEENQPAFRPRYDAQAAKTVDATKDIDLLLGAKSSSMKQEYDVNAGIAKRMASDHLMSLTEEITQIENTMKPGDNRDTAIMRLQSSIASTSGVSAGLSGDAALAYDEMYIPGARKMATAQMSKWEGEQNEIDKARLIEEFDDFLDLAPHMDKDVSSPILALWNTRIAPFTKEGETGVYDRATDSVINSIAKEALSDPTLTPEEVMEKFKEREFMGLASTDKDGKLTFGRNDPHNNAKLAKVLNVVFDEGYTYRDKVNVKIDKESKKDKADGEAKVLAVIETVDTATPEGKASVEKALALYAPWLSDQGISIDTATNDIMRQHVIGIEVGGVRKNVFNGGTTYSREGEDNGKGGKFTSAFGPYQFVKDTAQEYWEKAQKAGTIDKDKKMVHGKQTDAEQDAMYDQLLGGQKKVLKRLGVPVTPDNIYTLHQLGNARGARMISDTLRVTDLAVINDQLPKDKMVKFPELDPAEVKKRWTAAYRITDRASAVPNLTESLSKSGVKIAAKIGKQSADAAQSATKGNKEAADKAWTKTTKERLDVQKQLDDAAILTGNPIDEQTAAKYREQSEQIAEEFGRDSILGSAYHVDLKVKKLKAVDDIQNQHVKSLMSTAEKLAGEQNRPVMDVFNEITKGTMKDKDGKTVTINKLDYLVSGKTKDFVNNWTMQQTAYDANALIYTKTEMIQLAMAGEMKPSTIRSVNFVLSKMDQHEVVKFKKSKDYKTLVEYRNGEKYKLDELKESPLNQYVAANYLKPDHQKELMQYRAGEVARLAMNTGRDNPNAGKNKTKLVEFFGNDPRKTLQARDAQYAAKGIVTDALKDINEVRMMMTQNPELWNNPRFISAAKSGMEVKDNILMTVSMAIAKNAPEGELPQGMTAMFKSTIRKSMLGEVIKDENGDDVDFKDSEIYETWHKQNIEGGYLLPEEKYEADMAAKALVAAGMDHLIPQMLAGASGKYVNDLDGLNGRFQASGINDQLAASNYDQEDLTELVVTSMSRENHEDYNTVKSDFGPRIQEGQFTMGKENGQSFIVFPDREGNYYATSPKYYVDLNKLEVTRRSSKPDHEWSWKDYDDFTGGTTYWMRNIASEFGDMVEPERTPRVSPKIKKEN